MGKSRSFDKELDELEKNHQQKPAAMSDWEDREEEKKTVLVNIPRGIFMATDIHLSHHFLSGHWRRSINSQHNSLNLRRHHIVGEDLWRLYCLHCRVVLLGQVVTSSSCHFYYCSSRFSIVFFSFFFFFFFVCCLFFSSFFFVVVVVVFRFLSVLRWKMCKNARSLEENKFLTW